VEETGVGGELGVVGPAVLLPVRTVGRDPDEVVEERPARAVFQRVHIRIRTGESADFAQVAVNRLRGERENFRLAGNFHDGIAESVIGEAGMPALHPLPFQGVAFGLEVAALDETGDVVPIKRTVGVEHVAVLDLHRAPARPPDDQFGASGDVLPGVPSAAFEAAHREEFTDPAGRRGLFEKQAAGPGNNRRPAPGRIVKAGGIPAGELQPGVVMLPVAESVVCDRPRGAHPPAVVAGEDGFTVDDQLQQQFGVVAPGRLVKVPRLGSVAVVETVAENHTDGVASRVEQIGNVVDQISCVRIVVGRRGGKFAVPNLLSVEPELVITESAEIEPALLTAPEIELLPEIRRRKHLAPPVMERLAGADPECIPLSCIGKRHTSSLPFVFLEEYT